MGNENININKPFIIFTNQTAALDYFIKSQYNDLVLIKPSYNSAFFITRKTIKNPLINYNETFQPAFCVDHKSGGSTLVVLDQTSAKLLLGLQNNDALVELIVKLIIHQYEKESADLRLNTKKRNLEINEIINKIKINSNK
jgi:hypothetical protein